MINNSQKLIIEVCDEIKNILLEKNRKYGDSALNPVRVFSKADVLEQINVRMDDKLSRISNQQDDEDEDVFADLLGYLVLRQVAIRRNKPDTSNKLSNTLTVKIPIESTNLTDQYELGN